MGTIRLFRFSGTAGTAEDGPGAGAGPCALACTPGTVSLLACAPLDAGCCFKSCRLRSAADFKRLYSKLTSCARASAMPASSHRIWRTAAMHAPPFTAVAARGAALRPCDPSATRALEGGAPLWTTDCAQQALLSVMAAE